MAVRSLVLTVLGLSALFATQGCGGETTEDVVTLITKEMVESAQKAWGDGIVLIASTHTSGGDYVQTATDHINTLYGYGLWGSPVLFKPTLAADEQFRSTFDKALSYFVASNNACPEDKGFAIKGWTAVRFENVDIITEGSTALAMGNYFFTTPEGEEVKVEYSFGYMLDDEGNVRIILHHSSMPYEPSSSRQLRGVPDLRLYAPSSDKQVRALRGLLSSSNSRRTEAEAATEMTKELVEAAQKAWGDGIVKIAAAHTSGGDYVQTATDHINTLYAYGKAPVLFKPTLAADEQFRSTFDKALSYFVASNGACPEDKGFAIKGWTAVRFDNVDIITEGRVGLAMGNYFFTKPDGTEAKVEYSFGYMLDRNGDVRIILHHSSMPYAPSSRRLLSDLRGLVSSSNSRRTAAAAEMTKEMVEAAQKAWGDGIVNIAAAYTYGGDYVKTAADHINALYAYGRSPVLFKPTLAATEQFRSTFDKALSYFVASNNACPEDGGFAIKGWTAVRFENADIITVGGVGMAMGNYFFTKPDGTEAKVEYSFGYMLDADGNVRINLHHSSMPYAPAASSTAAPVMTEALITAAQKAWGDGIVTIATAHTAGDGTYEQKAKDHINTLYAYGKSPVLFKPTLAATEQFRSTFEKALSYFVATDGAGGAGACPEDTGFAIKGWTAVRFENVDIITEGSVGLAMGNYFFSKADGTETKVEYSFGYMLDRDGDVRIILHHSSMPYVAPARRLLSDLSGLVSSSNSRRTAAAAEMTKEMVEAAQKAWGDGIVNIAASYTYGSDYVQTATDHIDTLYAYGLSPVLFKPTLAATEQFRSTFDKALSYFVASNNACPEDAGFAIKGWTAVRFENVDIITVGGVGMAMGNYFFTKPEGTETKVEYSFGYTLDESGNVRITLHHSSLPYSP